MTKPFLVSPLDKITTDRNIKTVLIHVEKQLKNEEYLLSNGIFCVIGKIESPSKSLQINKSYVIKFSNIQMTKRRRYPGFTYLDYEILIDDNSEIFEIPSHLPLLSSIKYPQYFDKISILQEWIESINEGNYESIFQQIKESIFLQKISKMTTLARNIIHTIYIRKNIISVIAKLCIDIIKIRPEFEKVFLKECDDMEIPQNVNDYFQSVVSNPEDYYIFEKFEDSSSISYALKNDDIDTFQSLYVNGIVSCPPYLDTNFSFFKSCEMCSLISCAALYNSINIFKFLLLNHENINEETADCAVAGGNYEIVHIIEQHGINIVSSIQFSVIYKHNDIYDWLSDRVDSLNSFDFDTYLTSYNYQVLFQQSLMGRINKTNVPFKYLISSLNYELVEFLLDCGMNPRTNFLLAVSAGDIDMVEIFLKYGAPIDSDIYEDSPIVVSLFKQNMEMAHYLIEHGANLNPTYASLSPLEIALRTDDDIALFMLEKGAIPQGNVLFSTKNPTIIKELILKGADVNSRNSAGISCLWKSIILNQPEICTLLLERGADVNENHGGQSILTLAISSRCSEIASLLIDYGAPIESDNPDLSPIIAAIYQNDQTIFEKLIDKGCNINIRTLSGESLASIASSQNNQKMLNILLQKGAYLDSSAMGDSPILKAAQSNNYSMVKLLLENGVSPNPPTLGKTPLHYAVENNNKEMVEILLDNGADVNAKDNKLRTPLLVAAINKQNDIIKVLLDFGANKNIRDINGINARSLLCVNPIIF